LERTVAFVELFFDALEAVFRNRAPKTNSNHLVHWRRRSRIYGHAASDLLDECETGRVSRADGTPNRPRQLRFGTFDSSRKVG
jgi:hypothetical protein